MKNCLLILIIALSVSLESCEKADYSNEYKVALTDVKSQTSLLIRGPLINPFPVDTTLVLPAGQSEYCLANQGEFYKYVWALQYGPAATCPYSSYSNKSCQVNFTDGSSIICGTVQYAPGVYKIGGVSLQDITCNVQVNGFFTYILLNYYPVSGGQASATFPLYGCYNLITTPIGTTLFPISIIKNNITYILHTTNADYSYPESGQMVTKTIKTIQFI